MLCAPNSAVAAPGGAAKPKAPKTTSRKKATTRRARRAKAKEAPAVVRPAPIKTPKATIGPKPAQPVTPRLPLMSTAKKKKLLTEMGLSKPSGGSSAELSAARPYVPQRAGLVLAGADLVDPVANYVRFQQLPEVANADMADRAGTHARHAVLWIKGQQDTPERYLVDCTVSAYLWLLKDFVPTLRPRAGKFFVTSAVSQQTFTIPAGGGNLAFVLETSNREWHGVRIETRDRIWDLQRCQITAL
ncbi:MAG: hypothetical protein AAF721_41865 [Myxococcota bacterium]